jgi:kynurenine formamidase
MDTNQTGTTLEFETLARSVSNWGRWGADDERGTLNFITPETIAQAAALAKTGRVFNLSVPVGRDGPQTNVRRLNPLHFMTEVNTPLAFGGPMRVSDDFIALYAQSGTQWDALAHVSYGGRLYNDVPADSVTSGGASALSIDAVTPGVVGRGVLIDLARAGGVDWLPAAHEVTAAELDRAVASQNVEVRSGDILLIRTGWRAFLDSSGSRADFMASEPGLGTDTVRWLHEHEVAAVCTDNYGVEAIPGEDGWPPMALHMILIRDMGMALGELFDLEELARDCARDSTYEMLFVASPLRITAGVGSPTSPVAIK